MKSVLVYESMYGHTHTIAEAIARGLGKVGPIKVGGTDDITVDEIVGADVVVVGGPTHQHGIATESSRLVAIKHAAESPDVELDDSATAPALRDWLDSLPRASSQMGLAFDTRINKPSILTGSAARGIARRLHRHGFTPMEGPESFLLDGSDGPLLVGEEERAEEWGTMLARRCRQLNL